MNLILLPGNSPENKDWIEELAKLFRPDFETVWVQYWQHWQTNEPVIDLEKELDRLVKNIDISKEYAIFAKSAGVALTLKGVFENKIKPMACIFVGTPIFWARSNNFIIDKWLENFSLPSLFIQQKKDPAISSIELFKILKNLNLKNYKLVEIEGSSHHYPNSDQLYSLACDFIKTRL